MPPPTETSLQVRQAIAGERRSLEWIVEHFGPLLLAQARYRLGRVLQGWYDPEDLVQQVWAVCLPKLAKIEPRDGRYTPVLLRFLGTTLLRTYHHLVEKHLAGKPKELRLFDDTKSAAAGAVGEIPADVTGAVTEALRGETAARIAAAIDALPDHHREILVLRALEEMPYKLAAKKLGVDEQALRARYHRAVESLKGCLPPGIMEELREA